MNESTQPPTEADRVRRDTSYLKRAQGDFRDGFWARCNTPHPNKRNAGGKELLVREPKHRICALGEGGTVDRTVAIQRCHLAGERRTAWVDGFLHADNLCATVGLTAAKAADPCKVPRKPRESLAEPLDAFPDTLMTPDDSRAFWRRHRGEREAAPTTADEQG